jgi:hypothetical protein
MLPWALSFSTMTPLYFCNNIIRGISLDVGVFIFGGWMAYFLVTLGVGVSLYMGVHVISIMEA